MTIHLPEWDEQYHSKHGAIQEARHVFLKMGLHHWLENNSKRPVDILEIGFGTGLNAFLTLIESNRLDTEICYKGVEAYPVTALEIEKLNYPEAADAVSAEDQFLKLHAVPWEKSASITNKFSLHKNQLKFQEIDLFNQFDLVYFDAFGARVQPELWGKDIFNSMYKALRQHGVLVTYAAKGSVRRAMISAGFQVEKLPGPPGKREMLRAVKL